MRLACGKLQHNACQEITYNFRSADLLQFHAVDSKQAEIETIAQAHSLGVELETVQ